MRYFLIMLLANIIFFSCDEKSNEGLASTKQAPYNILEEGDIRKLGIVKSNNAIGILADIYAVYFQNFLGIFFIGWESEIHIRQTSFSIIYKVC